MRIVSYNVQFCRGRDGRCDIARIANTVAEADIIALQEVDRFWSRSGNIDQATALAEQLPHHRWVYGPGIDLDADIVGADGRLTHRRRQFGNMLLSRLPIFSARNHLLPKQDLVGLVSLQRAALEGVIACPSGALRILSVHLAHVSQLERQEQIERLLEIHSRARREGGARTGTDPAWGGDGPASPMPDEAILLGDFNMDPDSAEYALIAGIDDVKYGRIAQRAGFVDAWIHAGGDPHGGLTRYGETRQRRIDYAFVSGGLADRIRSVRVDDEAVGSDHQPVWLDIDI